MFIDRALKLRSTDRLPRDCFISPSVSFPSPSTICLLPLSLSLSLLHPPSHQIILILSCGELHIHTAAEYFCVCRQTVQTVGRACLLPHQSYETEKKSGKSGRQWMNSADREVKLERRHRAAELQRKSSLKGKKRVIRLILWSLLYMINSHLSAPPLCFYVFQDRAEFTGAKTQEENVQSRLQQSQLCTGWSLCGPSLFIPTHNHFLLLMFFFLSWMF